MGENNLNQGCKNKDNFYCYHVDMMSGEEGREKICLPFCKNIVKDIAKHINRLSGRREDKKGLMDYFMGWSYIEYKILEDGTCCNIRFCLIEGEWSIYLDTNDGCVKLFWGNIMTHERITLNSMKEIKKIYESNQIKKILKGILIY